MKKALYIAGMVGIFATLGALVSSGEEVSPPSNSPPEEASTIPPTTEKPTTYEITKDGGVQGQSKTEFSKTDPSITLSKWNAESSLKIKYADIAAVAEKTADGKIEYKNSDQELHTYPLSEKAGMEDGGLEIEVVLNHAPSSNVFKFQLQNYEDLDFIYQPPLANKNPDGSTWEKDPWGGTSERPVNVNGSYAVYHKTKKNYTVGQTNYATGKAYHIYRPKATDAHGDSVWGDIKIENGLISVTVPQPFLDLATYPVIVDPTIGRTALGASVDYTDNDLFLGGSSGVTDANGGTLSKVQIAVWNTTGVAGHARVALYTNNSSTPPNVNAYPVTVVANSDSGAMAITRTSAPTQDSEWLSSTSVTGTVAANTAYWVGSNLDDGNIRIAYDGGQPLYTNWYASQAYTSFPPGTAPSVSGSTNIWSAYFTYAAAAAATTINPSVIIKGNVIIQGKAVIR